MTEAAFAELVAQYEKLVYTICYQFTANHHTAEDLMQDTFFSVYKHRDTLPTDNPKAWVARVATNKAKDFLKSAYHRRVGMEGEDGLPENKGTLFGRMELTEDITIARDEAQRIEEDIRALKEPYHHVAVLYFIDERSVEEIAQVLARPSKTVHTQLYRAKRMLKDKLKGGGEDGMV